MVNPAFTVVLLCAVLLLLAVMAARRGLLTRRLAAAGAALHGLVVAAIVAGAYAGALPDWFRGRDIPHYDTFMHFYLVGLLTFFLEVALAVPPPRAGRRRLPVVAIACCAVALADELLVQPHCAVALADELLVQPHCANRGVSMHDALGNMAGALVMGYLALRARVCTPAATAL